MAAGIDVTRSSRVTILKTDSVNALAQKSDKGLRLYRTADESPIYNVTLYIALDQDSVFNSLSYTSDTLCQVQFFYSTDGDAYTRAPFLEDKTEAGKRKISTPLIQADFIQIVFHQDSAHLNRFEVHDLQIGFESRALVKATSSADRLWVAENLLDRRDDYGWSSQVYTHPDEDEIEIDLGNYFYVNAFKLRSIKDDQNCFPRKFMISVSHDKAMWETFITESGFYAGSFQWYIWNIKPWRTRYIRIKIKEPARFGKEQFVSKILDFAAVAVPENQLRANQKKQGDLPYASELIAGLVIFSENSGVTPNKAVQANDARLRIATTESHGIARLARDNDNREGVVVQGNDSRLRIAQVQHPGIVQLAKDGESRGGVAVQANDSRLRTATEEYPGVVQLARQGETRPGVAIQANDPRLKTASITTPGIVRLAANEEVADGVAVQSNDSRLRQASITWPGIIQIASPGETDANKALSSNDDRLSEGSEQRKGRVQLARHLESSSLKALQSDDPRVQFATESSAGVVRLSPHGKANASAVVVANDPRLSDKREPLAHAHTEYAPARHDLNTHQGNLNLKNDATTFHVTAFSVPGLDVVPLSSENTSGLSAAFRGGVVMTAKENPALLAVSEKNLAIEGRGKSTPAALFISESEYAVQLPLQSADIKGSGKSLLAEGEVRLRGGLKVEGRGFLGVEFTRFSNEAFSDGDLLTMDGAAVAKLKSQDRPCIGVFARGSSIELGSSQNQKSIKVAVAGIVDVKIEGSVKAGQMIGFSGKNAGTGKVVSDSRLGILVSLEDNQNEKEKLVPCVFMK